MGLLTGEALWTLAMVVVIFLLLVDLTPQAVQRWSARYPPGPMPLPVLGNLLQMDFQNMPSSITQLRRRFGDVFSLRLLRTPVVVVNGLAAVRETLVNRSEDTADRPPMPVYQHLGFGPRSEGRGKPAPKEAGPVCRAPEGNLPPRPNPGGRERRRALCVRRGGALPAEPSTLPPPGVVLARYGHAWREQRRFSLSTLRNFGVGKKSLEQWVTEEASCLCAAFADQAGRPFCPNVLLDKAVSNVITSLIFGRRFEYDDPRFLKLLDLMQEGLKEDSGLLREVLNLVPVLLRIPGLAAKLFAGQKDFMAMLDELITEHRMTRDPTQPPRDLTDAFLDEVEKAKGNPESSFNDENLRMVVSDLFSAGMVTTSTTLVWGLLFMIMHPDVQRRVHQEIDEVIGQARQPEMGDQARMPFTMAVVHEVQRFGDISPLGFPHKTSHDIEVQGFLIPKGTMLITNLSSVLKDETVWKEPSRFYPENFLDAQGRFVKQAAFMPFSAGRRSCLGEPLARMELFLFFACLLQRFSFSVPEGQPRPSTHSVNSSLSTPVPYQLCAVPR